MSRWKILKRAKVQSKEKSFNLITPGTVMEGKGLSENENNFIASVTKFGKWVWTCTLPIYRLVKTWRLSSID
ncbi:hypothetical protein ACEQPO_13900 [Bacillus sp. SL00103]